MRLALSDKGNRFYVCECVAGYIHQLGVVSIWRQRRWGRWRGLHGLSWEAMALDVGLALRGPAGFPGRFPFGRPTAFALAAFVATIPVAAFTTAVSPKAMPANAKPTTPTYWTSCWTGFEIQSVGRCQRCIGDGMSRLSKLAGRPQFTTMLSSYRHTGHSKVRLWQPALSGSTRASHIGLPQFGHDGRPNKSVCWLSFCNDIRSSLRKAAR